MLALGPREEIPDSLLAHAFRIGCPFSETFTKLKPVSSMAYSAEEKVLLVVYKNDSPTTPTTTVKYTAETPEEETWLHEGCIFWRLSH